MGKKRTVATPLFPFATSANEPDEPEHHFSDSGFDPQLLCFSQQTQTEAKRAAYRRHQQPLEPARFKLQKPISKKRQHRQQQSKAKQRRRWWSAALLFFKRPPSDPTARAASAASSSSYSTAAVAGAGCAATASGASRPLYLADDDDDATGCTCWAPPPMRSGHMAAAEVGGASAMLPYVSLRDVNLDCGAGGVTPSMMPIYLVT